MDFGFSAEQEQLRDSVRGFLARYAPIAYARAMGDDELGFGEGIWQEMVGLGWTGLTIPERFGGSELRCLDLAIVAEEMGAVVMPGPYLSTMALGVPVVLACANEEQAADLLGSVVRGTRRITVALPEDGGRWDAAAIGIRAQREGSGFRLSGTKLFVPDARSAQSIVIVARLDDGVAFFVVESGHPGLSIEPMTTVDLTRKFDVVTLESVVVDNSGLLGGRAYEDPVVERIIDIAKSVLSAEMCGGAAAALEMTVDYLKVRKQFDRPIGSFQALQHRCADMKVLLENARSLTYYANWAIDESPPDAPMAAAMAKAYCSEACSRIVADAIQLHGGIGFTWEHDLQLFFKRAKASEVCYGDALWNRQQVAALLEL
ncbi:MAG: acyl-CoA dehydrogenase family protein [Candidatus Binatia bacterium]